jgi:CheY-like chemotaxis protein
MLCSLLQLNGHEVAVSGDGLSGVELIRRLRPDTALVDVGLPALNGYEVATQVRADPACQNVRLIAMTGYGQPEDRRRALSAGFDAHLIKPVRSDQLIQMLSNGDTASRYP